MFKRIFASIAVLYGKQVHSETQSALIQQAVASNALSSAGTKVWIAGASSATGSWFLSNQFFGLVGALAAVIGVFVNIYFKRKETMIKEKYAQRRDDREAELHAIKTTRLLSGYDDDDDCNDLHDTDMHALQNDEKVAKKPGHPIQ